MTKPIVKNAADEGQVKDAERREKSAEERFANDVRAVMHTPEGRRVMWKILTKYCHYDTNDAQHSGSFTFFSLGERNVGRQLKADLKGHALRSYRQMEDENWDHAKGED